MLYNQPQPVLSLNMHYYTNFLLNIENYYSFKLSSSTRNRDEYSGKTKQGQLRPSVGRKVVVLYKQNIHGVAFI